MGSVECSDILQPEARKLRTSPHNGAQTENKYCDPRGYVDRRIWLLPEVVAAKICNDRKQDRGYRESDNSYRSRFVTLR